MCYWRNLFKLGLSEYQAKCTVSLIKNGDLKAQEVSEEAEVPYSKVYSILKTLENMGLISSTQERPQRYISRSEEYIVNFLVSKKENELARIREQGRKAKRELKSVKSIGSDEQPYKQMTLSS